MVAQSCLFHSIICCACSYVILSLFQFDTENKASLHSKNTAIIKKALSPDPKNLIRYSASPKYMLCKSIQQKLEMTNVSTKFSVIVPNWYMPCASSFQHSYHGCGSNKIITVWERNSQSGLDGELVCNIQHFSNLSHKVLSSCLSTFIYFGPHIFYFSCWHKLFKVIVKVTKSYVCTFGLIMEFGTALLLDRTQILQNGHIYFI